ncbi:MAG: flagellar biosynthetic protein FliR, partial [Peptococcaceae bacterium]|nr:flagellar biosynthetic protein FliR [Peptococcaceae bacterium]
QLLLGIALGASLLLAPGLASQAVAIDGTLPLLFAIAREFLVGLVWGLVFQIFYYMLFLAGDLIDIGAGLSMAKVFDRDSNIQMSLSGNIFQLIFIFYLFTTNSHLALIRMAADSFRIVGLGEALAGVRLSAFVLDSFLNAFSLATRLAMPFVAATMTLEFTMGVLMKLVPQIHVFAIHFQVKVLLGLGLLYLFSAPMSVFIDNYMDVIFRQLEEVLFAMG